VIAVGVAILAAVAVADDLPKSCRVDIRTPKTGTPALVGDSENVSGTAVKPERAQLWLFAHRKGLALWWPQGGGAAKMQGNTWQVVAFFGVARDIGSEFEITASVVTED